MSEGPTIFAHSQPFYDRVRSDYVEWTLPVYGKFTKMSLAYSRSQKQLT